MLARLERIPGVREARAEASGTCFLVVLEADAQEPVVVERALGALGAQARRLGDAEARAQLAARERGDPWFDARETLALCYVEARVLAVNAAAATARAADLEAPEQARVAEAAREVLFAVMERVHGEGGRCSTAWFFEDWPAIAEAISGRLRPTFPPDRAARVHGALAALHRR